MVLATVPAAPPTWKNQRATSWPAPISARVPYAAGSRFRARAFSRVLGCAMSMRGPATLPGADQLGGHRAHVDHELVGGAVRHGAIQPCSAKNFLSTLTIS